MEHKLPDLFVAEHNVENVVNLQSDMTAGQRYEHAKATGGRRERSQQLHFMINYL